MGILQDQQSIGMAFERAGGIRKFVGQPDIILVTKGYPIANAQACCLEEVVTVSKIYVIFVYVNWE